MYTSHIQKVNNIYIGVIEVVPLKGCQLDPKEYTGAAVRVYIPAKDEEAARKLLHQSLSDNFFKLVEVEFLVGKDDVEWDNPDDPIEEALSEEAIEFGEVIYGEFNAWDE